MEVEMNLCCSIPGCGKRTEGRTGLCASHNKASRKEIKVPIAKVSEKQSGRLDEYSKKAKEFLRGKRCAVYPWLKAVEVHHMAGRIGDMLMDETCWLPVSREGHMEIEKRPEWAKSKGFSYSRLTNETKI